VQPARGVAGNDHSSAGEGATPSGVLTGKSSHRLAGFEIPYLQRVVPRSGNGPPPVRTHRHAIDWMRVAFERAEQLKTCFFSAREDSGSSAEGGAGLWPATPDVQGFCSLPRCEATQSSCRSCRRMGPSAPEVPNVFEQRAQLRAVRFRAGEVVVVPGFQVQRDDALAFAERAKLLGAANLARVGARREQCQRHVAPVKNLLDLFCPDGAAGGSLSCSTSALKQAASYSPTQVPAP